MADGRNVDGGVGPPDEHLGDDVALLVLGEVDGDRRARMAAHVLTCATCRREYDELVEVVEDLLPAVPAVQPPLGFDERVLARLAADSDRPAPRRSRTWFWPAVAAAALVLLLVPVGIYALVRSDGDGSADGALATLELSNGSGPVGTVSIGDVEGHPVMVVALVRAPDDVTYFCRARLADGTVVESDAWPAGNGAWIVGLPAGSSPDDVLSVEVLPAGTDHVWSSATFPS